MAKQVTVFVDNRPGRLETVTKILFNENVNMRAMTIQDRGEFGLVRMLVDQPDKAYLALSKSGFACALKDILAISIHDKPGGLHELMEVFSRENINILDAYGFVIDSGTKAVFCVEVKDYAQTQKMLEKKGIVVLEGDQLYEL